MYIQWCAKPVGTPPPPPPPPPFNIEWKADFSWKKLVARDNQAKLSIQYWMGERGFVWWDLSVRYCVKHTIVDKSLQCAWWWFLPFFYIASNSVSSPFLPNRPDDVMHIAVQLWFRVSVCMFTRLCLEWKWDQRMPATRRFRSWGLECRTADLWR